MSPNRQLCYEDDCGMCDTGPCPLEAGSACSEFLADRDDGEPTFWRVLGCMAGVGAACILLAHFLSVLASITP